MGEEGFFRRSKSLPPKEGCAISAIYLGDRWPPPPCHGLPPPGLDLPPGQTRHPHQPSKPRPTAKKFLTALVLAACITLTATASLLYIIRAGRNGGLRAEPIKRDWSGEVIISGEFKITNEPYRPSLRNFTSVDFIQLSAKIGQHLNDLYSRSSISKRFRGATVVELAPGLTVKCRLVMINTDSLTVSRVGLAFLAGLKHSQGHLNLGPYIVDIQSIGFQATSDEVSWSQWSDWSPCTDGGRTRKRVCLRLTGLKLKNIEACRALQGVHDTEFKPCQGERSAAVIATLTTPTTSTTTATAITSTEAPTPAVTKATTTERIPLTPPPKVIALQTRLNGTTTAATTTLSPFSRSLASLTLNVNVTTTVEPELNASIPDLKRMCMDCKEGEVCVALQSDLVPYCRPAQDVNDPTGCGGHCKIITELCHRLADNAFRCVDDSKCLDDEWQCGNQLCIPVVKRCDGHFNCYDHTDEVNCDCDLRTHFRCGKNLSCLPKSKKCDGIVDCWDATDESSCTIACLDSAQFTCNDSQCIESKKFCDGFPDCNDHSDEPFGCGGVCKHHEWRCSNGRCITKREVCNGADDCGDNSDEVSCGKRRKIST